MTWLLLGHKFKNLIIFKSKSHILDFMRSRSINMVKIEDLKTSQVRSLLLLLTHVYVGLFSKHQGGNQFSRILGFTWIIVRALVKRCFLKQNKLPAQGKSV